MRNKNILKKILAYALTTSFVVGNMYFYNCTANAEDLPENAMVVLESVPVDLENTVDKTATEHVVTAMSNDINVIPDINNTGAIEPESGYVKMDGSKICCTLNGEASYINVEPKTDGTLAINLQYAHSKLNGHYIFENLDLSENIIRIYSAGILKEQDRNITFEFRNCNIKAFTGDRRSYDNIKYIFDYCTFISASGSDIVFNNCRFGGGVNDRMNTFVNCEVNNCYIYNPTSYQAADNEIHVDGVQMYGYKDNDGVQYPTENVHFNNCRFEMPAIAYQNAPKAYVNACIMLQTEFSDGRNISYKNCYVNGGGYAIYVHGTKGTHLSDITLENITFGCASKYGNVYPDRPETDQVNWNEDTWSNASNIYVGSVTRDNAKNETYLTVTNDTNQKRYFRAYTSSGNTYDYEIDACPTNKEFSGNKYLFEDMPFDVMYTVPEYCDWVVVYEMVPVANSTIADMVQVRFANWTNETSVVLHDVESTAISYKMDANGTMTISGYGEMPEYDDVSLYPWYEYKNKIKKVIVDGVTSISKNAFEGYADIEEVVLDEDTTYIDEHAFSDCYRLSKINLDKTEKLTRIGAYTFSNCISLVKVYLPASISRIESNAYTIDAAIISDGKTVIDEDDAQVKDVTTINCRTKTDIYYMGTINQWVKISFATSFSEPRASSNPQAEIGGDLYVEGNKLVEKLDCKNLADKAIGGAAFAGCKSLKYVDFTDVKEIGADAFEKSNITGKMEINETVTRMGAYAFTGCESITEIVWNSKLAVPMGTFSDCIGIKNLEIKTDIDTINNWAFSGCVNLEKVVLPDSIKTIKQKAFNGDKSLKDINMPKSLESISNYAFAGCSSLSEIALPEGVNQVDLSVFAGCTSLKKVLIPKSLTSLSKGMFSGCISLEVVKFEAAKCPNIATDAFKGIDKGKLEIIVPQNTTGYDTNEVIKNAASHVFEIKHIEAKSCIEVAKDIYTCRIHDNCDSNKYVNLEALTHTKSDSVKENIVNSTTTKNGSYDSVVYCKVCKKELSRTKVVVDKLSGGNTESDKGDTGSKKDTATKKIKVKTVSLKSVTSKITKKKVNVKKNGVKKYVTKKYKTITITWKRQSGVKGYIVRYSTDKCMKKGVHTKKIVSKKTYRATVKKLNVKKKYWVKVRAYKVIKGKTYYGKWSKLKKA